MRVNNYIYNTFGERGVKTFEKRVATILKRKGIDGYVICLNAYLERASGYNSYHMVAVIEIDKEQYVIKTHTNDSELWDSFNNTPREKRRIFLTVIDNDTDVFKSHTRRD